MSSNTFTWFTSLVKSICPSNLYAACRNKLFICIRLDPCAAIQERVDSALTELAKSNSDNRIF